MANFESSTIPMPQTFEDVVTVCFSVVYEYLATAEIGRLLFVVRTDAAAANWGWRIAALRLGAAEARPEPFDWRMTASLYQSHYIGLRDGRFANAGSCLASIPVPPSRHLAVLGKWLTAAPHEDASMRRAIATYVTGPIVYGRVGFGQNGKSQLCAWMLRYVPLDHRPMSPLEALRHTLLRFPFLPIDAGVGGDRTFIAIAAAYQQHQPETTARLAAACKVRGGGGKYDGVDSLLHILFYSLIMLNMDLHSDKLRNVGGHTAMTRTDWRRSLTTTVVGKVLTDSEMNALYDSIANEPLKALVPQPLRTAGWGDWLSWEKWL